MIKKKAPELIIEIIFLILTREFKACVETVNWYIYFWYINLNFNSLFLT